MRFWGSWIAAALDDDYDRASLLTFRYNQHPAVNSRWKFSLFFPLALKNHLYVNNYYINFNELYMLPNLNHSI